MKLSLSFVSTQLPSTCRLPRLNASSRDSKESIVNEPIQKSLRVQHGGMPFIYHSPNFMVAAKFKDNIYNHFLALRYVRKWDRCSFIFIYCPEEFSQHGLPGRSEFWITYFRFPVNGPEATFVSSLFTSPTGRVERCTAGGVNNHSFNTFIFDVTCLRITLPVYGDGYFHLLLQGPGT